VLPRLALAALLACLGAGLAAGLAADGAGQGPDSGAAQAQAPAPAPPDAAPGPDLRLLQARVRVFHPACSTARRSEVLNALAEASALLQSRCHVSLSLTAWAELPVGVWCHLEAAGRARAAFEAELAEDAKLQDPSCLAFFLLPNGLDNRLSWALVDRSRARNCSSPQEARFLPRFGSAFFTDLAWAVGRYDSGDPFRPSAVLIAHEVLHCLTQRGHPTGEPRGAVMADHLSDMGTDVSPDWCACARDSPYLMPAP